MIKLKDLTESAHVFGNRAGKEVYQKLQDVVALHPSVNVFGISLDGIEATDASFPRESVISLAKSYRGEKGFFLTEMKSRDLIDNWNYAAAAKEQPIIIWNDKENYEVIGPKVTSSTEILIKFVLDRGSVTTSKVANELNVSVQNASTKLKKLVNQGFIMRAEEIAESGGVEYTYCAIK